MTLKETLEGLPAGTIVSIGAASAYMYIGPKNLEEIEQVFEKCYQKQKDDYALFKKLRRNHKRLKGRIAVTKDMVNFKRIYVDTYIPVMDRDVLLTYDRQCTPGIGIKVCGLERGHLWELNDTDGR